jgi:hypothetical protein
MGIPMAYNTGTTNTYTEKTVKRGTVALNPGPSLAPSYNWFNGVDVSRHHNILFILTHIQQVRQLKPIQDQQLGQHLIYQMRVYYHLINTLPERIGQTPFTLCTCCA